jgi:enoyl-CoA hydratase/carnithine racemase
MALTDFVRFERMDHGVAELVLDRPQARNALSRALAGDG